MQETFPFHEDPGHGWVEVPMDDLIDLGIQHKISLYSYRHGNVAYLEEDCDASVWVNAMRESGRQFRFEEIVYPRSEAPIRHFSSYWV